MKIDEFFTLVDLDRSGTITLAEIEECMKKSYKGLCAKRFLNRKDLNRDGVLDKSEFIAFFMHLINKGRDHKFVLRKIQEYLALFKKSGRQVERSSLLKKLISIVLTEKLKIELEVSERLASELVNINA
mmetsp:Transcript_22194/g.29691  ORF Transcript_22194/g.29691 Transcript_22194/m.29691 type:complete len:129 (+) Transcript_22194:82-468(+)